MPTREIFLVYAARSSLVAVITSVDCTKSHIFCIPGNPVEVHMKKISILSFAAVASLFTVMLFAMLPVQSVKDVKTADPWSELTQEIESQITQPQSEASSTAAAYDADSVVTDNHNAHASISATEASASTAVSEPAKTTTPEAATSLAASDGSASASVTVPVQSPLSAEVGEPPEVSYQVGSPNDYAPLTVDADSDALAVILGQPKAIYLVRLDDEGSEARIAQYKNGQTVLLHYAGDPSLVQPQSDGTVIMAGKTDYAQLYYNDELHAYCIEQWAR